jgi:hypothetical protein
MQIKTHKMKNAYSVPHFFILSKGHNSGKPLEKPCPNCFVCLCKNEEEKQKLYWLFYGLWQGMYFHPFLTGSVIPFIRLDDVKQVIKTAIEKTLAKPDLLSKNISIMQLLDEKSEAIHQQIKLIKEAKKAMMYQLLK